MCGAENGLSFLVKDEVVATDEEAKKVVESA